jgi:hypothetical protein
MDQPIRKLEPSRRRHSVVRAYADRLRTLLDQVRNHPLDEASSVALVTHIVENRAAAAYLHDELANSALRVS